jgi:hypothetical protein
VLPSDEGFFGTATNTPIPTNGPILARIASIVIKGAATGSTATGDHFGFVAEEIGAFKVGGVKTTLHKGARNDLNGVPIGASDDLTVREV